jgi:DNA (cytosine-5)-methyltransferase 1
MREIVLDLFAGAGGLSAGFSAAGLAPSLAVEIDPHACATYEANSGKAPLRADLSAGQGLDAVVRAVGASRVFVLLGGPPCQGFSSAGARDDHDPRNALVERYLDVVQALRPRWMLFENVEGLLTWRQGAAVEALASRLGALGYAVRIAKLNFASYGLPQSRKRVVVVADRVGATFAFPEPAFSFDAGKHRSAIPGLPSAPTVGEALAGLGPAGEGRVPYASPAPRSAYDATMRGWDRGDGVSLHTSRISDSVLARCRALAPGQTMKDLPEELRHPSFGRRANRRVSDGTPSASRGGAPAGIRRLVSCLQSPTVTGAATREFVHPAEDRLLTLREAARLQGFPDAYEFLGPDASVVRQVGNAVPPLAAAVLAQAIVRADGSACRTSARGLVEVMLGDAGSPAMRASVGRLDRLMAGNLLAEA